MDNEIKSEPTLQFQKIIIRTMSYWYIWLVIPLVIGSVFYWFSPQHRDEFQIRQSFSLDKFPNVPGAIKIDTLNTFEVKNEISSIKYIKKARLKTAKKKSEAFSSPEEIKKNLKVYHHGGNKKYFFKVVVESQNPRLYRQFVTNLINVYISDVQNQIRNEARRKISRKIESTEGEISKFKKVIEDYIEVFEDITSLEGLETKKLALEGIKNKFSNYYELLDKKRTLEKNIKLLKDQTLYKAEVFPINVSQEFYRSLIKAIQVGIFSGGILFILTVLFLIF